MTRIAPWIAAATLIALTVSAGATPAPLPASHASLAVSTTDIAATTINGYNPPAAVIASGDSVTWTSTDGGHNQRETSLPSPVGSPTGCFSVTSTTAGPSAAVKFTVSGGVVKATVGSTTATCLNAVSVNGAAFIVPYHCTIHANMNGFVVVTA